jgi:hypothetical protein
MTPQPESSGTVYFLGAGASAADELPITNELNLAIASRLVSERVPSQNASGRAPAAPATPAAASPLFRYYEQLYGLTQDKLLPAASAWNEFLRTRKRQPEPSKILPNVVETLSLIDLAIGQDLSFGQGLDGARLLAVRAELIEAIATGVKQAGLHKRVPLHKELVSRLAPNDAIVSTNWDVLVERALTWQLRGRLGTETLRETNIDYGAAGARLVNWRGRDLPQSKTGVRKVLKLHGSLNWFYCARCAELYANVELPWVLDPANPRPDADYCHCGVPLRNIMIAPSYVKEYGNAHLQSVWKHATAALRRAQRWVFIGYSLPPDDYHIRGMLLRALRARLDCQEEGSGPPRIEVVYCGPNDDLRARYEDLFRLAELTWHPEGMARYVGVDRDCREPR